MGVAGNKLISLVVTMVIARMVMPEQYGLVAMLSIFFAITGVFIDGGLTTALVRDTKRTHLDCSTVFYTNIGVAAIFCAAFQFAAPFIADFYNMPELTIIARVSAIGLLIESFGNVQYTLLSAELRQKKINIISLIALIVSGLVGVIMAINDFQVWALVAQNLTSAIVHIILLWIKSEWYPYWEFSWISFKNYFSFGIGLLGTSLLNTAYNNIYGLVIGKVYKSADLALYNRAYSLSLFASATPTGIIDSIAYPTLSKLQENKDQLRIGYSKLIKVSGFFIFPACLGLGAIAYPLIFVLLTDVWIYSAKLLQIIVFCMMWYPIHAMNLSLLKVQGRGDLLFRLEVIKKIIGVITLCATVPFGLEAMCYGSVVSSVLCLIINSYYTGKFISLGIFEQLKDLLPSLILSILMFVLVAFLCHLLGDTLLSLITGIAVGAIFYLGVAWILRFEEIREVKLLFKKA